MSPKPRKLSSCRSSTGEPEHPPHCAQAFRSSCGASRSASSFSQPRPTIIASPPKLGWRARFWSVRIGTAAPGALIATPQP